MAYVYLVVVSLWSYAGCVYCCGECEGPVALSVFCVALEFFVCCVDVVDGYWLFVEFVYWVVCGELVECVFVDVCSCEPYCEEVLGLEFCS